MRIRAGLLIALLLGGTSALAEPDSFQGGLSAYNAKKFEEAQRIWNALAVEGDADALLNLGRMHDTGVGGLRADAVAAYENYLRSALAGNADAQFTVSQRLEDAQGVAQDLAQAVIWCSRAAARGHVQAQYRLGLYYETGRAAPRNPRLAAAWYRAAAESSPDAARRLAALEAAGLDDTGQLASPVAAEALVVERGEELFADLVWVSAPQTPSTQFYLQVRRLTGEDRGETFSTFLELSAAVAPLPAEPADYAWRVLAVDPLDRNYEITEWRPFSVRLGTEGPLDDEPAPLDVFAEHSAVIRYSSHDETAANFARDLAEDFTFSGLSVVEEPIEGPAPETSQVMYFYHQDSDMADATAQMLPGLNRGTLASPGDGSTPPTPGGVEALLRGGRGPAAK